MKRRLVKHGLSTLTVSLPAKWAKKQGLKAGAEVEFIESDKGLLLQAGAPQEILKKIIIDIRKTEPTIIKYVLPVLHKVGYDEITLTYDLSEQVRETQQRINNMLIGYEIVDQTDGRCVIKNISGEGTADNEQIIKRVFMVLLTFMENTLHAIESKNFDSLHDLLTLEETINKLTNYSQRLTNKERDPKSVYLYLVPWVLESMGDNLRDICKHYAKQKKLSFSGEAITCFKDIQKFLRFFFNFYYKFKLEEIQTLYETSKKLSKQIIDTLEKAAVDDYFLLVHLHSINQRIADMFGATMALHYWDAKEE